MERDRPGEVVAGFMAAAAIFVGLIAIVRWPVRLGPPAILVAVIAAGMGGRHERLAAFAVGVATVGWLLGMVVAVVTGNDLY
jgi:hypothetical protein